MPVLTFKGLPHTDTYRAADVRGPWKAGDSREVSDETAARLLSQFPGVFAEAGTPAAPEADRAVRSPKKRGKRKGSA